MATIFGTNGADDRYGTAVADLIEGGPSPNPSTDTGNDTLSGDAGNDVINGYGGNDSLDGGDGNDTLNGGDGNDILYGDSGTNAFSGGAGDDTVRADNLGVVGSFDGGIGTDTLFLLFNTVLSGTSVLTSVERIDRSGTSQIQGDNNGNVLDFTGYAPLRDGAPAGLDVFGAGGSDSITGTDLGDTLNGAAGNDTLNGGNGDDSLYGGSGIDTLNGGAGDDTLRVDNTGSIGSLDGGIGTDTLFLGFDITLDSMSRLVSIERVNTNGNKLIQGTGANNVLDFSGYAGFDGATPAGLNLFGAAGDDSLIGTAGGDTMGGGTGSDTLIGGDGDDVLDGGTGTDSLVGGLGNDTYRLESDADGDVVVEAARGGTDTVEASFSYTLSANLENLTLLFAGDVSGTGNAAANVITGNEGANRLSGASGDDTLLGGGSDDTLLGGSGNDLLDGGSGNDALNGGSGTDTMRGGLGNDTYVVQQAGDVVDETGGDGLDSVSASVSFILADGVENLTLTGQAGLSGTGNGSANAIKGNNGANLLSGEGGADTISGGGGDDTLFGGLGADVLTGGAGRDTFLYNSAAEGGDRIKGFVAADDTIDVSAQGFGGGLAMGSLLAGQFAMNTSGDATAAQGQFTYETDAGRLWWDADGTGSGAKVLIALLTGAPALTAADIHVFA